MIFIFNNFGLRRQSSRRGTDASAPPRNDARNDVCSGCDFEWEAKPSAGSLKIPRSCVSVCATKPAAAIFSEEPWPSSSRESIQLPPLSHAVTQPGTTQSDGSLCSSHGKQAREEPRTFSCCQSRALCFLGRTISQGSRPATLSPVSCCRSFFINIDSLPSLSKSLLRANKKLGCALDLIFSLCLARPPVHEMTRHTVCQAA